MQETIHLCHRRGQKLAKKEQWTKTLEANSICLLPVFLNKYLPNIYTEMSLVETHIVPCTVCFYEHFHIL